MLIEKLGLAIFSFLVNVSSLGIVSNNQVDQESLPIGQLLYVNVDGFGESPSAIHPDYLRLVRELKIGGVLPHFTVRDTQEIQSSLSALREAASEPLLIGMDFTPLHAPVSAVEGWVGFGFGAGILGTYNGRLNEKCLRELVILQAMLHRLLGYNHTLGPTVDRSRRYGTLDQSANIIFPRAKMCLAELERFGLIVTIKHFPYTPNQFSLHEENHDLPLSANKVNEKVEIFDLLLPKAPSLMTTHLFNSTIDPKAPVTFSQVWLDKLTKKGFQGLILSDALMMIDGHGEILQKNGWLTLADAPEITNPSSVFAVKALLAGHHMVILEGHAGDTHQVHRDLVYLMNQDTKLGQKLESRARQSLKKVSDFKAKYHDRLTHASAYKPEVIERIITLMNLVLENNGEACIHQPYWKSLQAIPSFPTFSLQEETNEDSQ